MITVGGYGNLEADNAGETRKGWAGRVEAQAAWIAERRRDWGLTWFAATELHAEGNAYLPLLKHLGRDWDIAKAPGGNLLVYVKDDVEVMGKPADWHLDRTFNLFHVRNPLYPETPWYVYIEHYTSGDTPAIEATKRKQAKFGNEHSDNLWRCIRCGDYNSWESSDDPTTPRGIIRSAGWRSLQHTAEVYENRDLNTGLGWGHDTREIEDMFTRRTSTDQGLVRVVRAKKWDVRPLTDHSAWFTGEFDITPRPAPVPTT